MRRILLLCRYSLASMALGSLPLVVTPQGRDLVTGLADSSGALHRALFYVTLSLWALSVWYWSRVLLDAEFARTGQPYTWLARELPRVLGASTLLLPAISIWQAESPLVTRLLLILGCVGLALGFTVLVRRRRNWLNDAVAVDDFSVSAAMRRPVGWIALTSIAVSLSLFVWFVWWPLSAGRAFGAIAVVFIAAANAVLFGSLAVFFSAKRWLKLDAIAFAAAAAFSFFNDNHRVDVQAHTAPLPSLEALFTDWLGRVDAGAAAGPRQPIFLVAAEGGGIRAAYWTGIVLSDLADKNPAFGSRLFAVSGISGGSLGAAMYAAMRQEGTRPPQLHAKTLEILNRADLLAPTLAKLVTGDFAQWFIPKAIHAFDRSTAMEQAMTAMYQQERAGPFSQSYFDLRVSADAGVPALIFNSTGVESGGRVVMAPFTWRPDQIPDTASYVDLAGGAAPTLAAAVHNSARFTYVSPAGRIATIHGATDTHVVDGGYFDPTGGETMLDVFHVLLPIAERAGVRIIPVFITNGRIPEDANRAALSFARNQGLPAPPAPEAQNLDTQQPAPGVPTSNVALYGERPVGPALLGELFYPLRAVLASRSGHGRVAIGRQRQTPGAIAFGFCSLEAPLRPPLGWELSEPMQNQLNAFWKDCAVNNVGREALATFAR